MQWHVFTYSQEKSKIDYTSWVERLLNGIHAENLFVISDKVIAVYHPSNYDDTFNSLGNPL